MTAPDREHDSVSEREWLEGLRPEDQESAAPDHEQAERLAKHYDRLGDYENRNLARAYLDLAAQLAEAQAERKLQETIIYGYSVRVGELEAQLAEAQERERIEEVNAQAWKTRAEDAEAQLAERERELEDALDAILVLKRDADDTGERLTLEQAADELGIDLDEIRAAIHSDSEASG